MKTGENASKSGKGLPPQARRRKADSFGQEDTAFEERPEVYRNPAGEAAVSCCGRVEVPNGRVSV
jgi:hypothetical protein